MIPAIDRVLAKVVMVPESGCWIFMGALHERGYGIAGLGGRGEGTDRTHRIVYRHYFGEIPDGLFVCHKCDVRSCCNPDHLFIGTAKDNMQDCVKKGRSSKPPANPHIVGSVHKLAKFTEEIVLSMRNDYQNGMRVCEIARKYGSNHRRIGKIVHRQSWKHI